MKLHVVRPATLLKSGSITCVFLKILRNFKKYLFCRTPPDIPGYNIEQTPTESNGGGAVMHISQKLSYKPCKDLQIYSPKEFEYQLIELQNSKQPKLFEGNTSILQCSIPQIVLPTRVTEKSATLKHIQKQPLDVFFKKSCSRKLCKIHRKTQVKETLL